MYCEITDHGLEFEGEAGEGCAGCHFGRPFSGHESLDYRILLYWIADYIILLVGSN